MRTIGDGKGRMLFTTLGLALMLTVLGPVAGGAQETVADGRRVSLEYTVTFEDKTVFDSNVGKEPLVYIHGSEKRVPFFSKHLTGLEAAETKQFVMPPEDVYGPDDPERIIEVPKDSIPEDRRQVGQKLEGKSPEGRPLYAEVLEIKAETVVIDTNHPLAGETLFFDVKILKVETVSEQQ
ncbi:MAG: FKBP-type peptidyl-prolyl cis-trans isomerase [Desulfurellaceae bacterium]|nr:FKBP-type peptidyl-prolyl cis-trans isomerase [Desulfurellaceae bacterium]